MSTVHEVPVYDWQFAEPERFSVRCPFCGSQGTFEPMGQDVIIPVPKAHPIILGHRYCPNSGCSKHIFFVWNKLVGRMITYPPLRLAFDKSNVPETVAASLDEAITCHANGCYTAAAIMIRRTLEAICEDKGFTEGSLHSRLQSLAAHIVLPKELIDAMFVLKVLGNDAAHIRAKLYDTIEEEDVSVAIDLTKEIIKALYQYDWLLSKLKRLSERKSRGDDTAS